MEHLRIDPRLDNHPDVLNAGFAGACVFQVILRAIAEFDKHGRLPGKFGPRWLVRRMNLEESDVASPPESFVTGGIERCVRAGLLTREGEDLIVPGWERFYTPTQSNAERQANYRERLKEKGKQQEPEPESVTTRCKSNATPHHSTPHHITKESLSSASQSDTEPEVPLLTPEEAQRTSAVDEVLAHYAAAMAANGREVRPTTARRKLVKARLKEGWAVEELKQAVNGLTWSNWHMGVDPKTNGQAFTDLKYCLGTSERVEEFIAKTKEAPSAQVRL
jgi:hypothetical protein